MPYPPVQQKRCDITVGNQANYVTSQWEIKNFPKNFKKILMAAIFFYIAMLRSKRTEGAMTMIISFNNVQNRYSPAVHCPVLLGHNSDPERMLIYKSIWKGWGL